MIIVIKVFRGILTIGLCTLISCTTYASDIDLSGISSNDSTSHNCIYESKFDTTNHWRECLICKCKINIESHNMNTRYTNGANSCVIGNRKITECSGCELEYNEEHIIPHTFKNISIESSARLGGTAVVKRCSVCNTIYHFSSEGYKYYYDAERTQEVDPNNVILPTRIYDDYGNSTYFDWAVVKTVYAPENFNTSYSIDDNGYITITVNFKVTDELIDKFSESTLANNNYGKACLWLARLFNGKENYEQEYIGNNHSYNYTTKTITYTYGGYIRDTNKDYMLKAYIDPYLIFREDKNGGKYLTKYAGNAVLLTTNFTEPTITSVSQ